MNSCKLYDKERVPFSEVVVWSVTGIILVFVIWAAASRLVIILDGGDAVRGNTRAPPENGIRDLSREGSEERNSAIISEGVCKTRTDAKREAVKALALFAREILLALGETASRAPG